jgi:hypothetical protein
MKTWIEAALRRIARATCECHRAGNGAESQKPWNQATKAGGAQLRIFGFS